MKTIPRASKADLKYYSSLTQKKYRQGEKKYIIEGIRLIEEALKATYPIDTILITQLFIEKSERGQIMELLESSGTRLSLINETELSKISDTVTSQGIVAIAGVQETQELQFWKNIRDNAVIVALGNISDPGNLGTIIRTCDWFGVDGVFLSSDTVELYNPKVVRSTMGAIFHLPIFTGVELPSFITEAKKRGGTVIATTLDGGKNAYDFTFPQKSILLFGSEAHGINKELLDLVDVKMTIPKFGKAESLNVGIACGIVLSLVKS